MAHGTQTLDHVQEATDKLLTLFESGNLPAAVAPMILRARAGSELPSDQWSFGNRILMVLGDTLDARGFRQWETVGRHVKKGAKAVWILGPLTKKITETDAETGEKRERVMVTGFKGVPVFRVEDTEGAELPAPVDPAPEALPLQEVATAWGYTLTYGAFDGHAYAWTRSGSAHQIHMMTHDPETFLHELGHAADARNHDLKGGQHPEQEMVAEMVGAVLAVMLDLPDKGRLAWARGYIEAYAHAAHKSLAAGMMGALARTQQGLTEIATTADELEAAQIPA